MRATSLVRREVWNGREWIVSDHAESGTVCVGGRIRLAKLIQETSVYLVCIWRGSKGDNGLEVTACLTPELVTQTQLG